MPSTQQKKVIYDSPVQGKYIKSLPLHFKLCYYHNGKRCQCILTGRFTTCIKNIFRKIHNLDRSYNALLPANLLFTFNSEIATVAAQIQVCPSSYFLEVQMET